MVATKKIPMLTKNLALLMMCWAIIGMAGIAHAADPVRKQFLDYCLASADDKYTLYQTCIGKFTKACISDVSAYDNALADIAVGSHSRNCMERESIWWDELYKEQAKKLTKQTAQRTDDKRIRDALQTTLGSLQKKGAQECAYVTTRWGYRSADLVQLQGIEDQFRCVRDISAENAITVYLWSHQ
jgi:hypothetical protein